MVGRLELRRSQELRERSKLQLPTGLRYRHSSARNFGGIVNRMNPAQVSVGEALSFLDRFPEVEAVDLILYDGNGVGRGKIVRTKLRGMPIVAGEYASQKQYSLCLRWWMC